MTDFGDSDSRTTSRDLINDLFQRSAAYSNTTDYLDTIRFVSEFKTQGPYNAYLLRRQNPRVSFATYAYRWERKYGVSLKPDARPLIILMPFAPIHFVYDIEDVEGRLPPGILDPFPATGIVNPSTWINTVRNVEAHNIGVQFVPTSRQSAGWVEKPTSPVIVPSALKQPNQQNLFDTSDGNTPGNVQANFVVTINDQFDRSQRYITLIHELAHVACGHLGKTMGANGRFHPWPDRQNLPREVRELEAESVAYIVGRKAGVESRSETYLASYVDSLKKSGEERHFNFDAVLSAATRLEGWGRRPPRKTANQSVS